MEDINKKDEIIMNTAEGVPKVEEINLEELKSALVKLESEVALQEEKRNKIDEDIDNTNSKIPVFNGRFEDSAYNNFCKSLGSFDQKMDLLKQLQRELSNKFIEGSKEKVAGVSIENQIKMLSDLIVELERSKTENSAYDDQQFNTKSRSVLSKLSSLEGSIKQKNSKYAEYLDERRNSIATIDAMEKQPETIKLKEDLTILGKEFRLANEELNKLRAERDSINSKLIKAESN